MVAAVPQIEGLTIEDMLELAKTSQKAMRHLPEERDLDHIDRKRLSDVLYTVERESSLSRRSRMPLRLGKSVSSRGTTC